MSNCVVGSSGFGVPGDVVAEHGVERDDHLSHDGNDDDLWFLCWRRQDDHGRL